MQRMSASVHRAIPSTPTPVSVAKRRKAEHGRELGTHAHSVQFYENDAYLAETVVEFFAAGLVSGQTAVAIATPEHRAAISAGLHAMGFDVDRARTNGQLVLLDASETLATFMVGALPDPARFRRAIDGVLGSHARFGEGAGERKPVLAFGELVDILWRQGNLDAAIRLEELWNEAAEVYSFSLLCAYSLNNFQLETHDGPLRAICGQHVHVVPTERYMQVDDGARLREIALLQQRALALEFELERRRHLESELRDALRSAHAANRAKSDFLAIMSHELRTPLNAIGGHAQLLEMGLHGPVSEAQREALTRVQRSQRHLLAMINDLLNLARCDTGQVTYDIKPVDLGAAVDEVACLLAPLATANGIVCSVVFAQPAGALVAQADAEKLHQILLNLIGNAIKFSTSGGRITVEAVPCATDASLAEIRVRDTGIGIAESKLDAIFEPFVQLGGASLPQRDGVGLGLSISRMLARGMGGDLTARSAVGVGSTLTLTLPLA